jgi:hypothetical protein
MENEQDEYQTLRKEYEDQEIARFLDVFRLVSLWIILPRYGTSFTYIP